MKNIPVIIKGFIYSFLFIIFFQSCTEETNVPSELKSLSAEVTPLITQTTVTTYAGGRVTGCLDGPALKATFNFPYSIDAAPDGSLIVVDLNNKFIRKISSVEPDHQVTTLYKHLPVDNNDIAILRDVAVAPNGTIYFTDIWFANNRIYKINKNGEATIFLEGTAGIPFGIAIGADGIIYTCDNLAGIIYKITTAGIVTALTKENSIKGPIDLAVAPDGTLYVASESERIYKVTKGGVISEFAGSGIKGFADGPADQARFSYPSAITLGDDGTLYVTDRSNNRVRMISNGQVITIAGNGRAGNTNGPGSEATFFVPEGITFFGGDLYVSSSGGGYVRKVSFE